LSPDIVVGYATPAVLYQVSKSVTRWGIPETAQI
jgi:hypothetical protein